MKVVVHPGYENIDALIRSIPQGMPDSAELIRDDRNLIYKITAAGKTFVVKQYKLPTLVNRIAYSSFRKSKARRSYEYARKLLDMGVDTAAPVAYIEISNGGLFHTGYFISEFMDYPTLDKVSSCLEPKKLLDDFSSFTAGLHTKRIIHGDYNTGNILFREEFGRYRFALVDNNRLRLRRPSKRRCANDFRQLELPVPALTYVISEYAVIRGWNPEVFCGTVLVKKGLNIKKRVKNALKRLIGKPVKPEVSPGYDTIR